MRKTTILLSMIVLAAMVLAACGGGTTSTSVAPTQLPVTSIATESSTATEAPTEAPAATETPGIPVTGGQAAPAGRMSDRLKFQVLDQAGSKLGTVSDLVLDLSKAKVLYVIVNSSGKKVAAPRDLFIVQGAASTGTGLSTSTPSSGTGLSTSTPGAGGAGTGTGLGSTMGQNAFIFQDDPNTLKNAPAFDDKNLPGLGQSPDSWDIAIRNYWKGGGATTSSNTPSPAGTAVTDMTPTATGGGIALSTSTPSVPVTGGSAETGEGATSIQGVALASKVIGAKVAIGMQTAVPSTGTGSSGASTSTPSAGGSGTSATSTPSAGRAGAGTSATVSGTIDDLIVNDAGIIRFVVVRVKFDDGEHLVPVPLKFLQLDSDNNFVLNVDAAMLQKAPTFQEGKFPDMSMSGWDSDFTSFWQSSGTSGGSGAATATSTP